MYYHDLDGTYPAQENKREYRGVTFTTWQREITSCNVLEVEVGTTGYMGGDTGHGGRTYLRIKDLGGTDMSVNAPTDIYGDCGEVEIMFGGDTELATLIEALKWTISILEVKSAE